MTKAVDEDVTRFGLERRRHRSIERHETDRERSAWRRRVTMDTGVVTLSPLLYDGLVVRDVRLRIGTADLDLARLRRMGLRDGDREETVREVGTDLLAVHELRQANGTLERAEHALGGVDAELALLGGIERRRLGAANDEHVLLEADVDPGRIHTRQLGVHHIGVFLLDDVDGRNPDA